MSWQLVQWAMTQAPMLTTERGKNDTTARFVLVALAEKARGEKPRAYPSITTLRYMTGLDREVVRRALRRLADGGLITDAGRRGDGVVCWQLNTNLVRPDTDLKAIETEVDQRKEKDRLRKQRTRSTEDVSTVLRQDSEPVSEPRAAESTVLSRESTVLSQESTVLRRDSTTQNSREPVLPGYEPVVEPVSEPVAAERAAASAPAVDALFDTEPAKAKTAKKPKRSKPVDPLNGQAQELATGYHEAMSKASAFMGVKAVVRHFLGVGFTCEQIRAGLTHMSTVDRHRPLTRQSLLAAIESPNGRSTNGHRSYQNPVDQSVYDEPLI